MAQLSRPYQIALGAMVLLALVWVVAFRGHTTSSSSTPVASTPAVAPAPTAASEAAAAAAPTKIYHGAAPGVEGLTRAINHAHGAVATSQGEAHQVETASAQPTGTGAGGAAASTAAAGSSQTTATGSTPAGAAVTVSKSTTVTSSKHAAAASTSVTVTKSAAPTKVAPRAGKPASTKSNAIPPHQAAVESELKHGEVAVVLFWNPRGADDDAVHTELEVLLAAHHEIRSVGHVKLVQKLLKIVGLELDRKIAVHYASAAQVSSFGSFTKTVQVYGTPTMLIINRHGAISTLTGLTDAFSIEQTIDEARQSP